MTLDSGFTKFSSWICLDNVLKNMPNFEGHCESTGRKLGCRFERIHKWMDSPSGYMGKRHRLRRHDPHKTPEIARELFSKHYPDHAHLIEEAVLDHIELDRNSGDFTYSETEKALNDIEEEREREAFRKRLETESRIKSLRATPKWLVVSIGSIIAFYLSYQNDPTHSSPLIAIFFLTSCFFLWLTFEHIGEYLGFFPFTFSFLTFIQIEVIIFLFLFGIDKFSLTVFGIFTGFYLFMIVTPILVRKHDEKQIEKIGAKTRKILEERRTLEIGEPEEEPDFLSEENLEAQGIPSTAVVDLEDLEDE